VKFVIITLAICPKVLIILDANLNAHQIKVDTASFQLFVFLRKKNSGKTMDIISFQENNVE
jgi:hypothetical protein